jgi:hypothetical protein
MLRKKKNEKKKNKNIARLMKMKTQRNVTADLRSDEEELSESAHKVRELRENQGGLRRGLRLSKTMTKS